MFDVLSLFNNLNIYYNGNEFRTYVKKETGT